MPKPYTHTIFRTPGWRVMWGASGAITSRRAAHTTSRFRAVRRVSRSCEPTPNSPKSGTLTNLWSPYTCGAGSISSRPLLNCSTGMKADGRPGSPCVSPDSRVRSALGAPSHGPPTVIILAINLSFHALSTKVFKNRDDTGPPSEWVMSTTGEGPAEHAALRVYVSSIRSRRRVKKAARYDLSATRRKSYGAPRRFRRAVYPKSACSTFTSVSNTEDTSSLPNKLLMPSTPPKSRGRTSTPGTDVNDLVSGSYLASDSSTQHSLAPSASTAGHRRLKPDVQSSPYTALHLVLLKME
mmetsp:Transcript_47685/g.120048  ORF Transcript_47685/g.120048 Transcript_47685/m.120048 type:complete len:296 (+) Transcript_47685:699-1586(+)